MTMPDAEELSRKLRQMHKRAQRAEGQIEKARTELSEALRQRQYADCADGQRRLVPAQRITRASVAYALKILGGPVQ